MSAVIVLAFIQAVTCCGLGYLFMRGGNWRLGLTQVLYGLATLLIFARRP